MSEIFEFKEAVLTIHLPQELDHPAVGSGSGKKPTGS